LRFVEIAESIFINILSTRSGVVVREN